MTAADFPFPMQWPVREVPEDPNLRVEPYQRPSVPAVAPPRVLTEEQVAAMVRADEAEEAQRRRLAAGSLGAAVVGVHMAFITPGPRSRPLWSRIVRWLARER